MKNELKTYASYFVSYLLGELEVHSNLKQIILFGSVAREEANRKSDIDIFVEVNKKSKKIETRIRRITEDFYESREAILFKNKGIDNKINIIVGKLNEWGALKNSIEGTGVVLYGPYISKEIKGRKHLIVSWDKININRGAFLNKIYGFSVKGKRYSGLLEKLKGRKLGKSTIMIPIEHSKEIFGLISKYGVNAKTLEVYA